MSVRWGGHSRCKHRLHVLSGIGTGGYRERPDCADMLPAGRVPIRIIDCEQPNFPKGLQDCASSSLRGFCGLSCRETIQVPEEKTWFPVSSPMGSFERIQQPTSWSRSLTGRQTPPWTA